VGDPDGTFEAEICNAHLLPIAVPEGNWKDTVVVGTPESMDRPVFVMVGLASAVSIEDCPPALTVKYKVSEELKPSGEAKVMVKV
jgi:hypothetical protein